MTRVRVAVRARYLGSIRPVIDISDSDGLLDWFQSVGAGRRSFFILFWHYPPRRVAFLQVAARAAATVYHRPRQEHDTKSSICAAYVEKMA